jgi:hypothetical protein
MNIPLDRLYNFLDAVSDHNTIIYRFFPHGSKNIQNLIALKEHHVHNLSILPEMICHDQEPLNFNLYSNSEQLESSLRKQELQPMPPEVEDYIKNYSKGNLRFATNDYNVYSHALLLHSEKNSLEVTKYQNNNFIPVYYWSHAVIARDWFRYASIDPQLKQPKKISRTFLIYNRAWTGTREYRLKFADLLVKHQLTGLCLTAFAPIDQGIYYQDHVFINDKFKPTCQLEEFYPPNTTTSCYSADYTPQDYLDTQIEVVLETLFDDTRLHLTEKSLRPIACGQPFILAATPGSLKYLQSYGFKTFDNCWDESYDQIQDPIDRLNAIIQVMKNIANLDQLAQKELEQKIVSICKYNQDRFFSEQFFNQVVDEYKENIGFAIDEVKKTMSRSRFETVASLPPSTTQSIWEKTYTHAPLDKFVPDIRRWLEQHLDFN